MASDATGHTQRDNQDGRQQPRVPSGSETNFATSYDGDDQHERLRQPMEGYDHNGGGEDHPHDGEEMSDSPRSRRRAKEIKPRGRAPSHLRHPTRDMDDSYQPQDGSHTHAHDSYGGESAHAHVGPRPIEVSRISALRDTTAAKQRELALEKQKGFVTYTCIRA